MPDSPRTAARQCDCDGNGWFQCPDCGGRGYFVCCPDDLCRGGEYCIHGEDGEAICETCSGNGEVKCGCQDE